MVVSKPSLKGVVIEEFCTSVVSQKQSVVYTSSQYKLNLKSLRDREIVHTDLYWFTLNQELHLVFPETPRESTKQSTLNYLQHHQRSDIDPLKTHTSFGSAQTPLRMLILTTSRTHNTSQFHTQSFFKVQKDYTCYRKDLKSIQDENPISHSLDQSNLQLFKSKISEKLKYVFL